MWFVVAETTIHYPVQRIKLLLYQNTDSSATCLYDLLFDVLKIRTLPMIFHYPGYNFATFELTERLCSNVMTTPKFVVDEIVSLK